MVEHYLKIWKKEPLSDALESIELYIRYSYEFDDYFFDVEDGKDGERLKSLKKCLDGLDKYYEFLLTFNEN